MCFFLLGRELVFKGDVNRRLGAAGSHAAGVVVVVVVVVAAVEGSAVEGSAGEEATATSSVSFLPSVTSLRDLDTRRLQRT